MPASSFEQFLSTPEMLRVFGDASFAQAMLDFEAALAVAQADVGLIPRDAAPAIAGCCRAELWDVTDLSADAGHAGSLAIPMVKALTTQVALRNAEAAGYVHWGATSQDVLDTALVLVMRRGLALIDRDLGVLTEALFTLADRHGDAPVLGRTLLQPAQVISFGFKLVSWIAPLVRGRQRLHVAGNAALQLQLGGAVGTLAAMDDKGPAVAARMADRLGLAKPAGAWHTQRDVLVTLACELGVLAGSLGKIAKDISLMAQAEVGELAEPSAAGRGGSSTMPHKRNPVASMTALAAALRAPHRVSALLTAMVQEHERGLGNWQAEPAEIAGLYASVHGALSALSHACCGLVVDRQRMLRNIDALQGLVFAEAVSMRFARHIGKERAHALLEQLSHQVVESGRHLREVTLAELPSLPELSRQVDAAEVAGLFDPTTVAQRATRLAQAQIAALRADAAALQQQSPWAEWLPTQEKA